MNDILPPNPSQATNPIPATKDDVEGLAKNVNLLLVGVVIVLFVGFVSIILTALGFVVDSWRFKGAAYQDLAEEVIKQNSKVDSLSDKLDKLSVMSPTPASTVE